VATFTEAEFTTAGDFTTSIDWGDGSATTDDGATGPDNGPFIVSGDHTYTSSGDFTITVTVTDPDGNLASNTC